MAPLPSLNRQGRRFSTQRVWWHARPFVTIAAGMALATYAGYSIGHDVATPNCMEDEVYAVQIDTNPNHGLTWACENAYDYSLRMVED